MFCRYFLTSLLLGFIHGVHQVLGEGTPDSLQLLCGLAVPESVEISNDTWTGKDGPVVDELDTFVLDKTGCEYEGLAFVRHFYPKEITYDGERYEWYGAVRARDEALIQVSWGRVNHSHVTYNFFVGQDDNNITKMYEYGKQTWTKHTPAILDMNNYMPVYLKIEAGILKFGKICDSEPMFTRDISHQIARGDRPTIMCHSWSYVGAKFLYNCPAHIDGVSADLQQSSSAPTPTPEASLDEISVN